MFIATSRINTVSLEIGIVCGVLVILTAGALPLGRWFHKHIMLPWQALTGAPAEETIDGQPRPSLPQQVRDLSFKTDCLAVTLSDIARVTLPNGNGSVAETVHRIERQTTGLGEKVDDLSQRIAILETTTKVHNAK